MNNVPPALLRHLGHGTLLAFGLCLCASSILNGQDRADMAEDYRANQEALHQLVGELSAEQWNFKTAEDRWSIAEIVEHIIVNEQYVIGILEDELVKMPTGAEELDRRTGIESQVATTLQDRSQKFQAPEFVQPTGRWSGGEQVLGAFDETRGDMIEFLHHGEWGLRERGAMHPILGFEVDVQGWATITLEHCRRHLDQIEEVMADPGFPEG